MDQRPRKIDGVMISGTFSDLVEHRKVLVRALKGVGLADVAMENDSAKLSDVIESSLKMVRDSAGYVLVISHKYGQIPPSPERNPDRRSITELEFNEAQRLGRPILLFLMGEDHPVKKADVEQDPEKRKKLDAFRERAKEMGAGSTVHRVYATFESLEEFTNNVGVAVTELRDYLRDGESPAPEPARELAADDPIPRPPEFYAEPPYIGSHRFVGRQAQLDVLDDWALPADAHAVLLFDAIGGAGKSMLTWEWAKNRSAQVRGDWAGRFWYSFYERGAVMADFCRRALAYLTEKPPAEFDKMKTPELSRLLLHHLGERPWLLVLDGLERVLVAYNRIDAAELADEAANRPTDEISHRDPCSSIRSEDDDLLRAMAALGRSKVLITSRLVPKVLLNASGQAIPGVLRTSLPGLRPADAEELLRSCGVKGDSTTIQDYLKSNCDCHPLVTGVVAGLINGFLPDKGNFDAWTASPDGRGRLNLAELDLIQKRNHILTAALNALPPKSRQLLSLLTLMPEAVDTATLTALNPFLPEEHAAKELGENVQELERDGLLQYDGKTKRYDLHPVVRGIAAGGLAVEERDLYGQRVVDHFSAKVHNPYEQAQTMEDVRDGIHVVRTLLKMGRHQKACDVFREGLVSALFFNLEAYAETLSLLRSFFSQGWTTAPAAVRPNDQAFLASVAGGALQNGGDADGAMEAYGAALASSMCAKRWTSVCSTLVCFSLAWTQKNRLAGAWRHLQVSLDLAAEVADKESLFTCRLHCFRKLARLGRWDNAEEMWNLLDPMGRSWSRTVYRPGDAERDYAWYRLWRGGLTGEDLDRAEQLTKTGRDRGLIRDLHQLRGRWHLQRRDWAAAATSFHEAVSMARAVGQTALDSEGLFVLAKLRLGELRDPRGDVEQLERDRRASNSSMAELWLAIGDSERAKPYALDYHKWACADGEPYVHRYHLNKARGLLEEIGAEVPPVPVYDPSKDPKLPWEDEVEAAIEELRAGTDKSAGQEARATQAKAKKRKRGAGGRE
jgi:hypothetical protein